MITPNCVLRYTTIAVCVATLVACSSNDVRSVEQPVVEDANQLSATDSLNNQFLGALVLKLMGKWHDVQADGITVFHEHWDRSDDLFYSGLGFVMSGADTVFIENLYIAYDSLGAHYSARIPTQNNEAYVRFGLTNASEDSMVFENPEHDFPQRIAYVIQGDSVWNVVVSGIEKGVARTEKFHFTRRSVEDI